MTTVSAKNISEIPALIDKIAGVADIFAFARYCPTSEEKTAANLRGIDLLELDKPKKFKNLSAFKNSKDDDAEN